MLKVNEMKTRTRVDAPNTIQDFVDIKNYYALVLPPSFGYYTSGMISI